VSSTFLLEIVLKYSLVRRGALQSHRKVNTRFVTSGHVVKKCKCCRHQDFSFYCKMSKVTKYGNFAHENMALTLEAFRNSLIGLRAATRVSILRKET